MCPLGSVIYLRMSTLRELYVADVRSDLHQAPLSSLQTVARTRLGGAIKHEGPWSHTTALGTHALYTVAIRLCNSHAPRTIGPKP